MNPVGRRRREAVQFCERAKLFARSSRQLDLIGELTGGLAVVSERELVTGHAAQWIDCCGPWEAAHVKAIVAVVVPAISAFAKLDQVRAIMRRDQAHKWILQSQPR